MEVQKIIEQCSNLGIRLWTEEDKLKFSAPAGVMNDEIRSGLRSEKKLLIEYLKKSQKDTVEHDEDSRYESFELSDIQASYLVGKTGTYEYGGVGCQIYVEAAVPDADWERLNEAWKKIVSRHDMLRAVIQSNGYQHVLKKTEIPDIRRLVPNNQKEFDRTVLSVREELSDKVYDSSDWPLFDLVLTEYGRESILHFSMDMLIGDSVSVGILLRELLAYYYGDKDLKSLDITYKDVLEFREKQRYSPANIIKYKADREYWMQQIAHMPDPPDLSPNRSEDNSSQIQFDHRSHILNSETLGRLKDIAGRSGLTISGLLLAAYSEVIGRWSRNKDYCVSVTRMNRPDIHPQIYDVIGDFTDVVILAVRSDDGNTFRDRSRILQERLWENMGHGTFSGINVLREINRQHSEPVLMPYVFTSTFGIPGLEDDRVRTVYRSSHTPQVFIDCQVGEKEGGLEICWDIRKSAFNGRTTEDMFEAYVSLLENISDREDLINEQDLVSLPEHTAEVRKAVNDTYLDLPEKTLIEDFTANAGKIPDRPALITDTGSISYAELYRLACGAAGELEKAAFTSGDKAAILAEKSVFQIAAALGTLMAGGIYVPLDPGQPKARISKVLEDTGAKIIFADDDLKEKAAGTDAAVITEIHEGSCEAATVDPASPAYIIYTSGSTGLPKGVVISHRAAENTIQDINRRFGVNESDVILNIASLAFDLSVYDIFGGLAAGAAVVLPDPGELRNADYLADIIDRNCVTIWNTAPAQMELVLASNTGRTNDSLRLAMLSGDWIRTTLPKDIVKRYPACRVCSLGGATEASIWSIYHEVDPSDYDRVSIPYGRPLANQRFYILDRNMRDCPDWMIGDIYIAGDGLADGYYGDRELTESKFFSDRQHGERLYATGDTGRFHEDGVIEFCGRLDSQVKINGNRVDLGEVESAVMTDERVSSAAAIVTESKSHDKQIYAFAVPKEREAEDYSPVSREFTAYLDAEADKITAGVDGDDFVEFMGEASDLALSEIMIFLNEHDLFTDTDRKYSYEEILRKIDARPEYFKLVKRWLNELVSEGYIHRDGSELEYHADRVLDPKAVEQLGEKIDRDNAEKLGSSMSTDYFKNSVKYLPELISGKKEPQEILFPKASTDTAFSVYHDNIFSRCMNELAVDGLLKAVDTIERENPNHTIRILEIGAGTGGTSDDILPHLVGRNVEYHFTDVSGFFLNEARKKYAEYPWMVYHTFDINRDYRQQGIKDSFFDIILCANVLHMSLNGDDAFRTLKAISNSKGFLIIIDAIKELNSLLTSMGFLYRIDATDERGEKELVFFELPHWYRNFKNAGAEILYKYPAEDHFLACSYQRIFISRFNERREVVSDVDLMNTAERQLPAYMVPKRITILDGLPATSNGKLDRKKLEEIAMSDSMNLTADGGSPRTPLEEQVEKIWMDLLDRDTEIGRDASFFDIGGDSLLLAQVIGRVKDEVEPAKDMGWDDLMRMMFQNNTISLFCQALEYRDKDPEKENRMLHVFSDGAEGSEDLVVMFSDGTGTLSIYTDLLRKLREDGCEKRIVGFNCGFYEHYTDTPDSQVIPVLGRECGKVIEGMKASGITLVGHCYGGAIAVEAARYLREQGIDTELILIDSKKWDINLQNSLMLEAGFASIVRSDMTKLGYMKDQDEADHIISDYKSMHGRLPSEDELADELEKRTGSLTYKDMLARPQEERINKIYDALPKVREKHSAFEYDNFMSIFRTFRKSVSSFVNYSPEKYAGDAIAYTCTQKRKSFFAIPNEVYRVADFAVGGHVEERSIEGDHVSCMQADHIGELAHQIES